jgi:hypothetical protein
MRISLFLLIALALLGAPAARGDGPAPGSAAAQSGPKDYSRNAATGDYAPPDRIRTSSLAGTTSPPPAPERSFERPAGGGPLWAAIAAAALVGGAGYAAGRRGRARVAA